jgi:quercetin dioxygenase-like cupin family protein
MRARETPMPRLIAAPTRIEAAGNKPKLIDEYVGRVNTKNADVSIAHMRSPSGWTEPRQRPEFTECTVVLRGTLKVEHDGGSFDVHAGQAIITDPGEAVRWHAVADGANTLPCACRPFRRRPCTARSSDDGSPPAGHRLSAPGREAVSRQDRGG